MARIEDLADRYGRHIATLWQRTVADAQRVVMVIYDKELERTLRARKLAFETATREAGHDWHEIDLSSAFAEWMAADDYRDEYFASPEDMRLKLENGEAASVTDLVAQFGLGDSYIRKILPIGFLAPDLMEQILNGRQPARLKLGHISDDRLPLSWLVRRQDI